MTTSSPKYKANPNNSTVVNRKDASRRTESLVGPIKLVLNALARPTLRNVAQALTEGSYPLPSGDVGEWKASQVKRVMDRFDIKIAA